MRISLNWLKEFVDIDVDVDELAHQLTMLGLEIEAIERPGAEIDNLVIGRIVSVERHPDADKLTVCQTDVGEGQPIQIVCGAPNAKAGAVVPTALVGATLPGGFKIAKRKMRGVESCGMMCSARELGLGDDHSGLMMLDPDLPVGKDAKPILGLDDTVIEIEVTPNRGDWASIIGVARELAALYKKPWRSCPVSITEAAPSAMSISSVTIQDPDLCPRYLGRVMSNVKIAESPLWLKKKLLAVGQRPINNVVDITNFVLLETGHPLHAFDYELLTENRIVVRRAKQGETIETIDGTVRNLAPDMLVIADAKAPVAVAGIMGGKLSEVGDSTTRVFLESAYFDPKNVRRTARALGMQTEASMRFQRGADPEMARYALDRAAALMQELAGATVHEGVLDETPKPFAPKHITLRYARANLLLGAEIRGDTQKEILEGLGFATTDSTPTQCTVRVPSWRHDASMEADLIEEVARVYGFERIPTTLPTVRPTDLVIAPAERVILALREYLVGQGLTETMALTFSSPDLVQKAELPPDCLDMVALHNPLSENMATMRSSLIPGLLTTLSTNARFGTTDLAVFEVGPVYKPNSVKDLPDQYLRVGVALTGLNESKHWSRQQASIDFYDIKGWAEGILGFFGLTAQFTPDDLPPFETGQSARIELGSTLLGRMGRVNPSAAKAFDIDRPVFLLEMDLDPLLERTKTSAQFTAVPGFPPSLRDLAVLVDVDVPAGQVQTLAQKAGGKILRQTDIFDVYTGKQVPQGKKSVALSLVFQADDRTLTDQDTQKAWDKILKTLQTELKAELR